MRKQRSSTPQWSQAVFHANLTALQENVWHLMMNAICGMNSSECIAKLAPDGWWEKMWGGYSQAKMAGFSEECFETWPKEGVMYGGTVFLPMLPVPHFGVSALPLWLRPLASDGKAWCCTRRENPRVTIVDAWERRKQDRNLYDFMWNGLSVTQAVELNEMMMGFPKGWTNLNASETQSCPSNSIPSFEQ